MVAALVALVAACSPTAHPGPASPDALRWPILLHVPRPGQYTLHNSVGGDLREVITVAGKSVTITTTNTTGLLSSSDYLFDDSGLHLVALRSQAATCSLHAYPLLFPRRLHPHDAWPLQYACDVGRAGETETWLFNTIGSVDGQSTMVRSKRIINVVNISFTTTATNICGIVGAAFVAAAGACGDVVVQEAVRDTVDPVTGLILREETHGTAVTGKVSDVTVFEGVESTGS